jgi:hypothetical protein
MIDILWHTTHTKTYINCVYLFCFSFCCMASRFDLRFLAQFTTLRGHKPYCANTAQILTNNVASSDRLCFVLKHEVQETLMY